MKKISRGQLTGLLAGRTDKAQIGLKEVVVEDMDLTGWNLSFIDFSWADFRNVKLDGAIMDHCNFHNAYFSACTIRNASLKGTQLVNADLRGCDLSGSDFGGADFYGALLEHACLEGVRVDSNTRFFRLHCPETGAFLGYKKCFNDRMVQLLIPKDARRSSGTTTACRCDKAKVLTIKSPDFRYNYQEAFAFVDDSFVYRVGEIAQAKSFHEDRWLESSGGIHFYLTREEAMNYMGCV